MRVIYPVVQHYYYYFIFSYSGSSSVPTLAARSTRGKNTGFYLKSRALLFVHGGLALLVPAINNTVI